MSLVRPYTQYPAVKYQNCGYEALLYLEIGHVSVSTPAKQLSRSLNPTHRRLYALSPLVSPLGPSAPVPSSFIYLVMAEVEPAKFDRSPSLPHDVPKSPNDVKTMLDINASEPPKKRRRVAKPNADKKFECKHDGCSKSYSRAEHLYRHQLNRKSSLFLTSI